MRYLFTTAINLLEHSFIAAPTSADLLGFLFKYCIRVTLSNQTLSSDSAVGEEMHQRRPL